MNYEEVLDKLDKTLIGDLEFKIALTKAVEKQIAKKTYYSENAFFHNHAFICPNCKELVGYAQKHCARCGQAIDWSGVK